MRRLKIIETSPDHYLQLCFQDHLSPARTRKAAYETPRPLELSLACWLPAKEEERVTKQRYHGVMEIMATHLPLFTNTARSGKMAPPFTLSLTTVQYLSGNLEVLLLFSHRLQTPLDLLHLTTPALPSTWNRLPIPGVPLT